MSSHQKAAKEDEDPPPYSEYPPAGTTTVQSAPAPAPIPAPVPRPAAHVIPRQFPPAFNLYQESSFLERTYLLGEHQSQPLYAVSAHTGWSGKPDVVLHNGPAASRPPLATCTSANLVGAANLIVALPPAPGAAAEESVQTTGFLAASTYSFAVGVGTGAGAGARRERFEWRRTHGEAVAALGGRGSGWKLVRLAAAAAATSDGREVVAVWAWAVMSLSKKMRFRFLGSGASGALGERWAIMAVVTALWMFDRERRQKER